MSRYFLKDKSLIMTDIETPIKINDQTLTMKQIYLGEFPRGKVKTVKIGSEPQTCERLRKLGYPVPQNHVFVTQIDTLRQHDSKYRGQFDPLPLMKVCVNCGICQLESDGALVRA